jgi:hypothetical protein
MSHFEQHDAVKAGEGSAAAAASLKFLADSYPNPGGGGSAGKADAASSDIKAAGSEPRGGSSNSGGSDTCIEIKPLKQGR